MDVLNLVSKGGKRGGVGLHLQLIRAELVKTLFKLSLGDPVCQVLVETRLDRKSSQP